MKKRISFLLVTVMAISLLLSACGQVDPDQEVYNGRLGSELKSELDLDESLTAMVCDLMKQSTPDHDASDYLDEGVQSGMNMYFQNYFGVSFPEQCFEAASSYEALEEECGEWNGTFYVSEENPYEYSVDIAGKTMTTNAEAVFSKRNVEVQMVYNVFDNELTAISFNPKYTMGEKLQKAGMNTLISISIVFAVLILISIIIYCFNIFPYLEKRKKAKAAAKAEASQKDTFVTQIEQREEMQGNACDTELIAGIAAAIAASEGTSTSDFVVRSINRR